MTYKRKYDFKSGTTISSSQVDAEFDQLIAAVNALESSDNSIKSLAQMMKITNDDGSAKLNIQDSTKDLFVELSALGKGMHSFYATNNTKNSPGTNGARGIFNQTSDGYGWAIAFDYTGAVYVNSLSSGAWKKWRPISFNDDTTTQNVLWQGQSKMVASTTVTPSKKLSECRNGWILVWSDFDDPGTPNDFDFVYSAPVPKYAGTLNGKSHLFSIPNYLTNATTETTEKRLYVYDNKLVGHDDNGSDTTHSNDVCLRAVLEW